MFVPSLYTSEVSGAMAAQSGFLQDEGDKSPLFGLDISIWSMWCHPPHKRRNRDLTANGPAGTARETDVKSDKNIQYCNTHYFRMVYPYISIH